MSALEGDEDDDAEGEGAGEEAGGGGHTLPVFHGHDGADHAQQPGEQTTHDGKPRQRGGFGRFFWF